MNCDIIIPTFNNRSVLPATLAAVVAQTVPPPWRVGIVVSDDGSTDGTLAWVRRHALHSPVPLTVVAGPHLGSGGARNRALQVSQADLVFLLGADILLRPGALAAHLDFHATHSTATDAALGMVKWDPRLRPSPLMEWMTHGGQQNAFDNLLGALTAEPQHYFYGSHLSLKRAALRTEEFSQLLPGAFEDIELGRRLSRLPLTLYVLHRAVGLHHHYYSLSAIARRQWNAGHNVVHYQTMYPTAPLIPKRAWRVHVTRWIFCVFGGQALLYILLLQIHYRYSLPRAFAVFTTNQFWRGLWASTGGFLAFLRVSRSFSSNRP